MMIDLLDYFSGVASRLPEDSSAKTDLLSVIETLTRLAPILDSVAKLDRTTRDYAEARSFPAGLADLGLLVPDTGSPKLDALAVSAMGNHEDLDHADSV